MKIIIIVDMQNDFITGSLGSPEAVEVRNKMIRYLNEQDYKNTKVIFTMDTHYSNYLNTFEGQKLPIPHCIKDIIINVILELQGKQKTKANEI